MSALSLVLRHVLTALASAVLLHLGARLLAGPQSWRSTFRILFPGLLFLLSLGAILPLSGAGHLAFVAARFAAALALVGMTYGLSFARVCGVWIIATAIAGGFFVPAVFVKAVWDGVSSLSHKREARKAFAPQEAGAAVLLQEQALKAIRDRRFAEAERSLRQALQLRMLNGRKDIDLAITYYTLGDMYHQQQRWMKAEESYRQALLIAQDQLPDTDPALGNYFNALGAALYSQKRVFEAEAMHRKAMELLEPHVKKQPTTYKLFLRNYSRDLHELGRHKQALELEKKAAQIAG